MLRNYVIYKALLILLLLSGPLVAWSGDYDHGILWQVSKAGQKHSFILGTMHSDDPAVTNLPPAVMKAFGESTSFTAELDLNVAAMLQAQMQMLLPENQSLQNIVGPGRFRKCVNLMNGYGLPEMMVDRLKPWAIAAQLNMPKPTSGLFLDIKLYQMAQQRGLKTYGLETVDEQMSVFDGLTKEQQIKMLDQAIKDHPTMPGKISGLIRYYLNRDLKGMLAFSNDEMDRSDPELRKIMEDKLINSRNHRMVERMQPQVKEGLAFIAVGALHLPGEQGILALLKQRGFQVKPIY